MTSSVRPLAVAPARTGEERATLVRRTYGLVLVGVVLTIAGVAVSFTQPSLIAYAAQHPFITWLVGFMAPLFLAQMMYRTFPANIALTLTASFGAGVMISPVIAFFESQQPGVSAQAGMLTFAVFGGLTAYAAISRRDFSAWGGFFFVGLIALIVTSVLNMFFHNAIASLWIAGATVVVFGGLLVFDTWRLLRTDQFGPDDYVLCAVSIYLDLLNIFLAILRLFGGRRSN